MGAPLEESEMDMLSAIYEKLKPFLTKEGIEAIEEKGLWTYFEGMNDYGTTLLDNGACAFLTFDKNGIGKCGIEKAWEAGAVDFKKPISCHLYPARVSRNETTGFEALNYDRWDICFAATLAGKREKLPIFRFVKDAIVRKYGEEFYEEMEAAAAHLESRSDDK